MRNLPLNTNLVKLVSILNDGQYHDGNRLGAALNMTRAAIWKLIAKLNAYGVKIDSVKGKGYALLEPLSLLDKNKIKRHLQNKIALEVFESILSTNDYLKQYYQENKIRVCLAESQLNGRGRFQREWHSPFAKNIYLSCLYPFKLDVSQLSGLSLVVSLMIVDVIKALNVPKPLSVKWPNDVIYEHKKLSGCLIELQAESYGESNVIIGIGLNVNMLEAHISSSWTSLREVTGEYLDRNQICINLINHLFLYFEKFERHGLSYFLEEWRASDYLRSKNVALKAHDVKFEGNVKGIDANGHLLLKLNDGVVRAFSSGDTTIIK